MNITAKSTLIKMHFCVGRDPQNGDETSTSFQGFIGNTALGRIFAVNKKTSEDL
jgi:hypothetical protein